MSRPFVAVLLIAFAAAGCATPGVTSGPGGATQPPAASPAPGSSTAPADSVNPSTAPVAAFSPISLSGTGDKIAKFTIPADQAAIAVVSAKGSDNFVITSLAADGSDNDLLVNTIGSYSGTVLFDITANQHSVAFKVEASGFTWSIKIEPISSAKVWSGSSKITGKGDFVIQLDTAWNGLTTLDATGSGTGNFVVSSYSADGSTALLVNEIGHYSGQVALPDGSNLIQIEADGAWSLAEGS